MVSHILASHVQRRFVENTPSNGESLTQRADFSDFEFILICSRRQHNWMLNFKRKLYKFCLLLTCEIIHDKSPGLQISKSEKNKKNIDSLDNYWISKPRRDFWDTMYIERNYPFSSTSLKVIHCRAKCSEHSDRAVKIPPRHHFRTNWSN